MTLEQKDKPNSARPLQSPPVPPSPPLHRLVFVKGDDGSIVQDVVGTWKGRELEAIGRGLIQLAGNLEITFGEEQQKG